MNGRFCGEAWDAISRYVYAALQGGSIMHKWTNDDRIRFSIEFAEDVAPDALFHAVREVQARYPYYLSMLKKH